MTRSTVTRCVGRRERPNSRTSVGEAYKGVGEAATKMIVVRQ
ncbi:hypothetical protein [Streptomyces sp. NPDC016845]